MKNKKSKIIAFVLVFALLITTVIVISVANAKTTDILISADKENLSAGESAIVSVKVTTNYPVATMSIPVFYDKTLVDISDATTTLTEYSVANTTTDNQSVDTAKVYANTDIDSSKFGFVLATYIGGANEEVAESIDEVVLTFKITAKADASGSAAIKVVKESAKTSTNVKGMLYSGASTSGKTITEIPENVKNITLTNAIANVKIGADKPQLKLTEKGKAAGAVISESLCTSDGFTGALFGVETLGFGYDEKLTLQQAFEPDEGYIVVDTTNSNGKETTGAVVNLYTDDDEHVASYVFIYFGDVNKDGDITLSDATLISEYYGWVADIDSEAGLMAADPNADKDVTLSDATLISEYYGWVADMPEQAEIATIYNNQ